MTFTEKLERLTDERVKTKICVRAGLPKTAINDMIAKGYKPNSDAALRLARALNVSLEWLIDDEQNWPPVSAEAQPRAAVA